MGNELMIISSTEDERDYIQNAIIEYNAHQVPFTQIVAFENINFVVKNSNDEVIAGINSLLYCWGILYLDTLWVSDGYRSKGLGSQLLNKVEQAAKQKGCYIIHLDTFDFQAKEFYLKHGFEVYGILEDCPPGHNRFNMKKKL